MTIARSPLAPETFAQLPPIAGVDMATHCSGLRYKNRDDVLLFVLDKSTQTAGVFTQNKIVGAPVTWTQTAFSHPQDFTSAKAVLINAGNANVFTGEAGKTSAQQCACAVAELLDTDAHNVALASTGVIGQVLNPEPIVKSLKPMLTALAPMHWDKAARAIMTTDTFPKLATCTTQIDGHTITINGIAKGSGMIAPNMATMLGFIFTDAAIAQPVLRDLLRLHTADSFNAITVDSDTSTSDMVLLCATGAASHALITHNQDPKLADVSRALRDLMQDLAQQIVRDGEGARKFITVNITGAADHTTARQVAMSIANSPLVKTAIAGEDANWGRIAMAVGKAGVELNPDTLSIALGPHEIARSGGLVETYTEEDGAAYMKRSEIDLSVDLGMGSAKARVWTCDLTHQYIDINADYRS